ncbi:hypothetical protein Zmor_021854 [Zophobas morio]|uniref:TNFR-Cys domain-containing protein n=1 Tax=Zophobas morio TaxID=2755281 RepID=A0AA38I6G6_9CUCU|nr:hypothetical protein Zmor_021854 [Zophobas morio]
MMRSLIFRICLLVAILSYAHSRHTKTIEKRQCSGNNCNTCNGGNCNTCNGGNCNTCNGGNCNTCNGGNCNACNNNVCCSSASCNQCANQCSSNCNNNVSCKNNCVSGCVTACQGNNNCTGSSCSQCINNCGNQWSSKDCLNDCSKSCDGTSVTTNTITSDVNKDSVILIPASSDGSNVIVNNTNNNLVNLTTVINIDNVVHNINNISIPVYVNTTNINNINLSQSHKSTNNDVTTDIERPDFPMPLREQSLPYYPPIYPFPPNYPSPPSYPSRPSGDNCCFVLHPRTCYTDNEGNNRCYIRRSRECSDACTSPVISIEQGSTTNSGCQRVGTWPYQYCGNYIRRDCNQCYTCGGSYNPSQCFRQSECSDSCRSAAPSCVPSQSGLRCY